MVHTVLIMIWTILSTVILGVWVILFSFITSKGILPHRVACMWAETILMVSHIRVKVIGLSNIDPKQPYIYMCNHQSNFDIPVIMAHLPVQFRWLAKAELFKIPIFSTIMRRAGYISIDRKNRKSSFESLKRAAATIRKGASVMIFPEGTRSLDGSILPFKPGGFVLAVEAGVPLVPIILHGTAKIMPKNQKRITPGQVILEIKPPIETAHYNRKTRDDLMKKVRDIICDNFENSLVK